MRILIAPDKFKGSLSAREVSLAIERGLLSGYRALDGEPSDPPQSRIGPQADDGSEKRLHQAAEEHPKNYPNPQIFIQPIGDGGEGTMQLLCESRSECKTIQTKATGSLGAISDCEFYETVEGGLKKAYIEMASINGLALLDPSQRDPEHSLSTGTGELIVQAMERGAAEIYVGLGGSATVDGGAGALEALGFIFRDRSNRILAPGESIFGATDRSETVADALLRIASLTIPRVMSARLFAVVDVDSPLNGPGGAIASFALQKGLAPERLELYGRALEHFPQYAKGIWICGALLRRVSPDSRKTRSVPKVFRLLLEQARPGVWASPSLWPEQRFCRAFHSSATLWVYRGRCTLTWLLPAKERWTRPVWWEKGPVA